MNPIQRINTVLHLQRVFPAPRTAAVILAGGSGTRVGADTPKQLISVCDKPVLIHSALAFQKCRLIREIVIVTRAEDCAVVEALCRYYGITKCSRVVPGGTTRQESAALGFGAVSPKSAFVAFHDAARCLVTPAQIRDVALAAYAYGAASAATKATDTVKVVNCYGMIEKTLPRNEIMLAATPQIFNYVYYKAACVAAEEKGTVVTDDNSLMELIGQRVKLVDTGAENFKITVPSDLLRAEAILKLRAERKKKHGR